VDGHATDALLVRTSTELGDPEKPARLGAVPTVNVSLFELPPSHSMRVRAPR
jgi:hypothetical protein